MAATASLIISRTIVYSIVYSDADQRKHQSSASLAFVRGIHWGPVNSPHKWPVTWKMFRFDDVIMWNRYRSWTYQLQWLLCSGHVLRCELRCLLRTRTYDTFFPFIAIYHLYTCYTSAIMSWLGLTEPREIGIIGHLVMNGAFSFATERNTITRNLRLICFKLMFPNTNKTPKLHDETQINLHLREYTRKWAHTQILWLSNLFVTHYHYANWPLANIYQDSAQLFCDLLIVIYLSSNHL